MKLKEYLKLDPTKHRTLYKISVSEDLLYFVLPKLPTLETTCFVLGK